MIIIALSCYDFLFISCKRYLIGEVLKRIFFRNPGITKLLALERDVKPRNVNFTKVDGGGGGGGLIGKGVNMDKYGRIINVSF